MKLKLVFLSLAALSLSISSSYAASTHLSEYEWKSSPVGDIPEKAATSSANDKAFNWGATDSEKTANTCSTQCSGFSKETTSCDTGQELINCEVSGCGEYRKCEESGCAPGYDKEFKDCAIDVQEDNYLCSKCIE